MRGDLKPLLDLRAVFEVPAACVVARSHKLLKPVQVALLEVRVFENHYDV
jgi:hypothetical protein